MFEKEVASLQDDLKNHEIYRYIRTPEHLKVFMEGHLFAVWDFMSLLKRLQRELTTVSLPWFPAKDAQAARYINEIVMGEETDIGMSGAPTSHFEMYLSAMRDVGASRAGFDRFAAGCYNGRSIKDAASNADLPSYVSDFIQATLSIAMHGTLEEVASSFYYGREDSIPEMFQALLDSWAMDEAGVPQLVYYLKRHIELDGDEHGPAARRILTNLVYDDASSARALAAAKSAIKMRLLLWDGILADLKKRDELAARVDEVAL